MIKTDCHLHSSFSSDSDTPMIDMIHAATDKGLDTICFTEHMDLQFPDKYDMDFIFEPEKYMKQLNELKNTFSNNIDILAGIETGLKPGLKNEYDSILSMHEWDYVIGSTHLVDDIDPYYSEYWEGYSEKTAINRYFECVYDNIQSCGNYDAVGHLDYILRYAPSKNKYFSYKESADIIDCILKKIIYEGKALEINTNGYRSGLSSPNPCSDIIKRYMELGGVLFTIGSDAHCTGHIAYGYNEAYNLLSSLGIKHYAVYKKRKPEIISLV